MTTLVNCAKEMRKCEEISRLGGAKDGGKEMPPVQGGSFFFAFVVIFLLVGFLFLFVSLLLYFFCAVIIAKELIIDKDRLCGLQGSLQPGPLPQILHLHLKVIADGCKTESFFLNCFNAPSAGGFILTRANVREPQT